LLFATSLDYEASLRAKLVDRAEDWRWCSLSRRIRIQDHGRLHPWPRPVPEGWIDYVNQPQTEQEISLIRDAIVKGAPLGDQLWRSETAEALELQSALRRPGRPSKKGTDTKLVQNASRPLFTGS
jgi:putative transposase